MDNNNNNYQNRQNGNNGGNGGNNYNYNYNYNYNNYNYRKNHNNSSDVGYWIGTVICLGLFWPLGLIMLCRKLYSYYEQGKFKWTGNAWQSWQNWQNQNQSYTQNTQNQSHYYDPYSAGNTESPGSSRSGQQSWQSEQYRKAQESRKSASGTYDARSSSANYSSVNDIKDDIRRTVSEIKRDISQSVNEVKRDIHNSVNDAKGTPDKSAQGARSAAGKNTKQKSASRANRSQLRKAIKTPVMSIILLILAIILLLLGTAITLDTADSLAYLGFTLHRLSTLSQGLFLCAGGSISLVASISMRKRTHRFAKYAAVIGGQNVIPLSYIVSATGFKDKRVRKDLQKMIDAGYFGPDAYFDIGLDSLVLNTSDAEKVRQQRYKAERTEQEKPEEKTQEAPENKYMQILNELRKLNDTIVDGPISEKISRIEALTAKIFRTVEDNPEKKAQIGKFMDYYLPTTLKLLNAYSTLERQGIEGENISSAKQDIERILDTLANGYEQQLDQLYKSEMMDISSDIDVLETMLRKDGLSDDGSVFRAGGQ